MKATPQPDLPGLVESTTREVTVGGPELRRTLEAVQLSGGFVESMTVCGNADYRLKIRIGPRPPTSFTSNPPTP